MNDFVYVGKIVNTHGIRGEIRLMSKFTYKKRAFRVGGALYIGRDKVKEVITGYRVHKCFDMLTLEGYTNINEILKYKGALCYVKREDLLLAADEYLDTDLIHLPVIVEGKICGEVLRVEEVTPKNRILWISYDGTDVAIPFVSEFVDVDMKERQVIVKPIEGLL